MPILFEFIVAKIQKNLQSTIYHIINFDIMCITAVIKLSSGIAVELTQLKRPVPGSKRLRFTILLSRPHGDILKCLIAQATALCPQNTWRSSGPLHLLMWKRYRISDRAHFVRTVAWYALKLIVTA